MISTGIIGGGALGALYGDLLRRGEHIELFYAARGERAGRLREHGLIVNGEIFFPDVLDPGDFVQTPGEGCVKSTEKPHEKVTADIFIFAVKHQQLEEALEDASPFIGPQTVLLSVMNGIGSEKKIGERFGTDHLLYCVALGMDALREENRLVYTSSGKTLIGREKNPAGENPGPENQSLSGEDTDQDLQLVRKTFDAAGILWETPVDMVRSLWWKFMINIGVNQVSAVLGADFGVFHGNRDACVLMEKAMGEVILVAEKENVSLHDEDIAEWYTILGTLSPDGKTSMLQDMEAGRKTEVEMFAGHLMELAARHGVRVPVNETLFHIIRVKESRALQAMSGDFSR